MELCSSPVSPVGVESEKVNVEGRDKMAATQDTQRTISSYHMQYITIQGNYSYIVVTGIHINGSLYPVVCLHSKPVRDTSVAARFYRQPLLDQQPLMGRLQTDKQNNYSF